MTDLNKLNDQFSELNTKVEIANNTAVHMARDLDEIKDILQKSTDAMNKIFTDHSIRLARMEDADEVNKKKIRDIQSDVNKANTNIGKVRTELDGHVSYIGGVVDTFRWIKWFAFGGGAAGLVSAFKAFLL